LSSAAHTLFLSPTGGEDTVPLRFKNIEVGMPQSGSEGEQSEALSTLTPSLSRQREREIWSIFPAMSGIRVD